MSGTKVTIISGELQIPINIDQPIWSENCVKLCKKELLKYGNISTYNSAKVSIKATSKVEDVDISFIAYLVLIKSEYSNIKIVLDLKLNGYSENPDLASKINHYMAHAEIMFRKNVFTFSYGERAFKNITESNFTWSEDFFPIIYLDPDLLIKLCLLDHKLQDYTAFYDVSNETFYQNCRRNSLNKSKIQIDDLIDLGYLYTFKSLKILNITYDKEYLTSGKRNTLLRSGNLTGQDAYRYYERIKVIIEDLKQKPPIFMFLFSVISSAEKTLSENEEVIDEKFKLINRIWYFTNESANGIIELAKNICQHSSHKRGVISGRVYRKKRIIEYYKYSNELENVLESYYRNYKDDVSFLLLNVVDNGEIGVIETLKQKIDADSDDAAIIKNYSYKSLLNPDSEMLLSHQAKRATAHMGLLIFSKLIKDNNGFLRAGTWKNKETIKEENGKIKFKREDILLSKDVNKTFPLPEIGTWYQILLPFDREKKLSPQFGTSIQLPEEISIAQLNLFETYLKIKNISDAVEIVEGEKFNYILNIDLPGNNIVDRYDESILWNDIRASLNEEFNSIIINKQIPIFICLNFENVKIHPSALLRLLGKWELKYTSTTFVIYNIGNDQYQGLMNLNEIFCGMADIPLWNKESAVLFYNYILHQGERFYFVDLLWGEDKADFIFANKLIRKTNFVSTILTKSKSSSKNKHLISKLNIFLETYLFPFDIFLTTKDGTSLFEVNAKAIISNEMN